MGRARALTQEYGSLGLLLLAVAIGSASLITSCGSSGGDADGSLCSQCGVSPDGPCQEEVFVAPGPDADELCSNPAVGCNVELTCRRKVDSAQQRCFPHEEGGGIDFQFECDGSRPGGTVIPQATVTPTATATLTSTALTATATATPAATATAENDCGNGEVDADEDCEGTDLEDNTCEGLCDEGEGNLTCNSDCTFNFSGCDNPGTCSN